jgi:hypothetical protein
VVSVSVFWFAMFGRGGERQSGFSYCAIMSFHLSRQTMCQGNPADPTGHGILNKKQQVLHTPINNDLGRISVVVK